MPARNESRPPRGSGNQESSLPPPARSVSNTPDLSTCASPTNAPRRCASQRGPAAPCRATCTSSTVSKDRPAWAANRSDNPGEKQHPTSRVLPAARAVSSRASRAAASSWRSTVVMTCRPSARWRAARRTWSSPAPLNTTTRVCRETAPSMSLTDTADPKALSSSARRCSREEPRATPIESPETSSRAARPPMTPTPSIATGALPVRPAHPRRGRSNHPEPGGWASNP